MTGLRQSQRHLCVVEDLLYKAACLPDLRSFVNFSRSDSQLLQVNGIREEKKPNKLRDAIVDKALTDQSPKRNFGK